jgi:hypothetical protein
VPPAEGRKLVLVNGNAQGPSVLLASMMRPQDCGAENSNEADQLLPSGQLQGALHRLA